MQERIKELEYQLLVKEQTELEEAEFQDIEFNNQEIRIQTLGKKVTHWKTNHNSVLKKLQYFTQRPDLKINKIKKQLASAKEIINRRDLCIEAKNRQLEVVIAKRSRLMFLVTERNERIEELESEIDLISGQ